jgi:hypothetical protein
VLGLRNRSDPQWRAELSYERPGEEQVLLTGSFGTETIRARLRRVPTAQYPLVSRGFHWINEFSNNR